ncbi:MAG TPA: transglycosylase domain-containing protein [Steroidobacteraceae bacterium]
MLAAVAVLASCFLIYDALVFQSRSMQIRQLLVEAHPLERAPPETLRRLFLIEAGTRLDIRVARSLMLKLEVSPISGGNMGDRLTTALWTSLVRLHLSEDEKIALIFSLSDLGNRVHGFQAAARSDFGRDLDRLDPREQALLVVYSQWPSGYRQPQHEELVLVHRDSLINALANGTQ